MTDYLLLAVAMLITGGVGGILAGLLGIGGGIVIVPVMEAALTFLGVDEAIRMHVAVATSLATIVPTSIASSRAHHRRKAVDFELIRRWTLFVFFGALAGTVIASQVHSNVLAAVFAVVALLVAAKMMLPLDGRTLAPDVPKGVFMPAIPAGIGAVSSMMGIGGGTLSVATLTLFNQPIHRAVGTAALFGLAISIPGTIGFMVSGFDDARLPPGSIGYVNLIGFALISPMTFLAAPIGAAIAHRLSQRHLSLLFGIFLLLVSLRMFYRATSG
ncbi:MAG: sulfite exporter TauE/SafE family protein [Woeseia sp.]